ncbi:amidohydrolase family protein [Streptomyces sp. NPDC056909]|uniref:N-acyl-D-amino-acid deacylase family protein n=1 Tax=Streptomyces sp. NPDC056909 TaxID=3345963 RepID=UPI00368D60AE
MAVGSGLGTSASRVIDADGRLVTPGFFDPHTHIDAQIAWDPTATPLGWHGVTSAVMGNCGITFAPCRPGGESKLADMMEAVEEVSARIILSALPWDWEGYDEYLESVDRMPKAINVGGMVGHSAVRAYAMGIEESLDPERAPTRAELDLMRELVDNALRGGALGFSTTRTLRHTLPDGRPVPGSFAGKEELLHLCEPLRARSRGVIEVSARLWDKEDYGQWRSRFEHEMGLMTALSRSTGRTVTFSLFNHKDRAEIYRAILDRTADEVATGASLRPQVAARRVGELIGLGQNVPFEGEAWDRLRELRFDERLAALENADVRQRLIESAPGGDSTPTARGLYYLGSDSANYEYGVHDSLEAQAKTAGETPAETFIRYCRGTRGRAVWVREFLNQLVDGIERSITDPNSILGLGDAGAHVGGICDSSLPSYVLKHWVRDRRVLSLAEGVKRLTRDPATLFGQEDRGVLRAGSYADVNIIDLDALDLIVPEYKDILPGGDGMWIQKSRGYELTLVNGRVFMEAGEFTGEVAGRTLRAS